MKAALKARVRDAVGVAAPWFWRGLREPRLVILTYHRILPADHPDARIEQPGMQIRPETLAMHLDVLRRRFAIVDLDQWLLDREASRPLPRLACAITFDDGWKDNYDYAFPVLRAKSVPATLFVVTDLVGTSKSFWPNRLSRLLQSMRSDAQARSLEGWPEALRQIVSAAGSVATLDTDAVINACKGRATDEQINAWLDAVPNIGRSQVRDLLSWEEIAEMQASGLVRIGSHTMRHTRFIPEVDAAVIEAEVSGARRVIQQRAPLRSDVFCYPNGDYFDGAVGIVANHHLGAVTTRRGWNRRDADSYRLQRISLHEDISNTPERLLAAVAAVL